VARAGFCSECSATVWVRDDGSCERGHPASSVSDVHEAEARPAPSPTAPGPDAQPPKRHTGVIIAVALAIAIPLACLVVGILVAIAIPVFSASSQNARSNACFSNERTVEGAIQQYLASDPSAQEPADWRSAMAVVVPRFVKSEPVCVAGATYSLESGRVECTVHGSYQDASSN
jgi:hypothetical protein